MLWTPIVAYARRSVNVRLIDILDQMRWIAKYGNVINISMEYKYGNKEVIFFVNPIFIKVPTSNN